MRTASFFTILLGLIVLSLFSATKEQWEYRTQRYSFPPSISTLNVMGHQGWEAINMHGCECAKEKTTIVYFKRRK